MSKTWIMVSLGAFIIGLVLAVVGGLLLSGTAWVILVLAILGLVVGFIQMNRKDINTLLLAAIALLAMTAAFAPITVFDIGKSLGFVLVDFATLMAPVALIAAVKALVRIGMEKQIPTELNGGQPKP